MTPDVAHWLLSDEADPILRDSHGVEAAPAAVAALRQRLGDAERAAAVLALVELRSRARAKFAEADRLFLTRKGLEQSTDQWIASEKAKRFVRTGRVVDACCGVGGDLMALARVTQATGVDADPVVAAFAERNAGVAVSVGRLHAGQLPECDAWHADPDRRPAGRRTSQPEAHQPTLETLSAWREHAPAAAIKFAPAARLPSDWQSDSELEWISRDGECRQLVAWCGPLASTPGLRRATRVSRDGSSQTIVGAAALPCPVAEAIGGWLYEPDSAVLAANLVGSLCEVAGLRQATPSAAYLTGDQPAPHALVASFRVIETMPFDRKRLAGWLSERNIGRVEIKCRGVDVQPERLRRELKPRGQGEVTVLLFPDRDRKVRAVLAERPAE